MFRRLNGTTLCRVPCSCSCNGARAASAEPPPPPAHYLPPHKLPPRWDQFGNRSRRRLTPAHLIPLPPQEIHNVGITSGYGPRMYTYERWRDHVRTLPTVARKFDATTPHERDWTEEERVWWRKNYPPLYVPRHAWNINPHTLPYNSRAFFEYLTRTIGEAQLPDEQLSLDQTLVDTCAARVEDAMRETLASEYYRLDDELGAMPNAPPSALIAGRRRAVNAVIAATLATMQQCVGNRVEHLRDCQIDISAPLDAFWTRTGFQFVYERYPEQFPTRFLGDSRRYGGELAMRIGDIVPAVLRTRRPLARQQTESTDHWLKSGIRDHFDDGVIGQHTPLTYRLNADTHPLDVRCGYDAQNDVSIEHRTVPFPYIHTVFVDSTRTLQRCRDEWRVDDNDKDVVFDTLYTQAMLSAFAACVTQAYAHGYSLYDDLPYAFTSTCCITDTRHWMFVTYNLRTMRHLAYDFNEQRLIDHLLGDVDVATDRHSTAEQIIDVVTASPANRCWHSDIYTVYDVQDDTSKSSPRFVGWNREAVKQLVRHVLRAPISEQQHRQMAGDQLRPYLKPRSIESVEELDPDEAKKVLEMKKKKKDSEALHPVEWRLRKNMKYRSFAGKP